jgi:hypothetical protein
VANSASTRAAAINVFWGTTQISIVAAQTLKVSTAYTAPFFFEFNIIGTSTTAAAVNGWVNAYYSTTSPTTPQVMVAASETVTAGSQTITVQVVEAGTIVATDTWNLESVTFERLA